MLRRAQNDLREQIGKILLKNAATDGLSTLERAEMLIAMAMTQMDYNDGPDDTKHAMKRCHELVDKIGEAMMPTPKAKKGVRRPPTSSADRPRAMPGLFKPVARR